MSNKNTQHSMVYQASDGWDEKLQHCSTVDPGVGSRLAGGLNMTSMVYLPAPSRYISIIPCIHKVNVQPAKYQSKKTACLF
jgi:hypothetical protein